MASRGDNNKEDLLDQIHHNTGKIVFGLAAVSACAWAATRLHTVKAGQLLLKTGMGISTRKIGRTFVQLPYQHIATIDYQPFNVGPFVVDSVTEEKTKVDIPVIATVRPFWPGEYMYKDGNKDGDLKDAFENYVSSSIHMTQKEMNDLIQPMIQGEIRRQTPRHSIFDLIGIGSKSVAASDLASVTGVHPVTGKAVSGSETKMVLEGLDSQEFSSAAIATAQRAMIPHGLRVVNLTIMDLQNHHKSDIKIIDEITTKGTQEIAAEARIGAAKAQQKAIEAENKQKEAVAKSKQELDCAQATFVKLTAMAQLHAHMDVEQKKVDMLRDLETKRRQQQEEALRATDLAKATVAAESHVAQTQGEATAVAKKAEGEALAAVKHAEGQAIVAARKAEGEAAATAKKAEGEAIAAAKQADGEAQAATRRAEGEAKAMRTIVEAEAAAVEMRAQAEANAERQRADAHLFAEEKRAAGIAKIWAADNEGLNNMWKAVAGDSQLLQFVLASKRDTNGRTLMGDLAAQSASAIQGLKPTISIVKMGGGQGEGSDSSAMKPITEILQAVPPVSEFFKSQGLDFKAALQQHFPGAVPKKE